MCSDNVSFIANCFISYSYILKEPNSWCLARLALALMIWATQI